MVLGALIGAGATIGSGLLNAGSSARAASQSFAYNKALMQMQQEWQERMSNTAHQREVADLKAAGLNPILSATGGSGASFGSASASGLNVTPAQFSGDLGISSALAIRQQKNNNKQTEAQTAESNSAKNLNDKLIEKAQADIDNSNATTAQNILESQERVKQLAEQTKYIKYNAETNRISANASQSQSATSAGDLAYKKRTQYYEKSNENPFVNTVFDKGEKVYNHFKPTLNQAGKNLKNDFKWIRSDFKKYRYAVTHPF